MTSAYLDRPLRTYKQALKERKTDRGLLNFLTYQAICALPDHKRLALITRDTPAPAPCWRVIV